jgi:hypothetical protein
MRNNPKLDNLVGALLQVNSWSTYKNKLVRLKVDSSLLHGEVSCCILMSSD